MLVHSASFESLTVRESLALGQFPPALSSFNDTERNRFILLTQVLLLLVISLFVAGFAALSKKSLLTPKRATLGALAIAFTIALTTLAPSVLAQTRPVPPEARGSGPSRQAV